MKICNSCHSINCICSDKRTYVSICDKCNKKIYYCSCNYDRYINERKIIDYEKQLAYDNLKKLEIAKIS